MEKNGKNGGVVKEDNDMAIYEDTYDEAKNVIVNGWIKNRSKPHLFAQVRIRFGEKWMVDYTETQIRPGIEVIEDLIERVDEICASAKDPEV